MSEPSAFELSLEDFAMGLRQEHVSGIVSTEHVEEESARCLELARAFPEEGTRKDETGNARDLPELPLCHLRCVE